MWFDLALIAAGGFLAALVIGSAGFAFALIAGGIWSYVLPPPAVVLLASVCATPLHMAGVWRFRRDIKFALLWPFIAGGMLGVPLGVWALSRLDPIWFRHLFGGFMIAYSVFMLIHPNMPAIRLTARVARLTDAVVGWVAGMMGGLAMLHGTLPTVWCQLRGWDKQKARSVYQPYILLIGIQVMLLVGINVDIDKSQLMLPLAVCLPAMAAGLWLGMRIFDWISEQYFRRVVLWLILASGISLLL